MSHTCRFKSFEQNFAFITTRMRLIKDKFSKIMVLGRSDLLKKMVDINKEGKLYRETEHQLLLTMYCLLDLLNCFTCNEHGTLNTCGTHLRAAPRASRVFDSPLRPSGCSFSEGLYIVADKILSYFYTPVFPWVMFLLFEYRVQ